MATLQNSIQILTTKVSKEFVKVKTPTYNETILYIENGFIYKPFCYQVKYLKVRQHLENCNKDVEWKFLKI